jgi:hypothetical protein
MLRGCGYYGSTTELLRNRCRASLPVTTVIMSSVLSEAKGTVGRRLMISPTVAVAGWGGLGVVEVGEEQLSNEQEQRRGGGDRDQGAHDA